MLPVHITNCPQQGQKRNSMVESVQHCKRCRPRGSGLQQNRHSAVFPVSQRYSSKSVVVRGSEEVVSKSRWRSKAVFISAVELAPVDDDQRRRAMTTTAASTQLTTITTTLKGEHITLRFSWAHACYRLLQTALLHAASSLYRPGAIPRAHSSLERSIVSTTQVLRSGLPGTPKKVPGSLEVHISLVM